MSLADALTPRIRAAAYHAGLSPEVRDRVQNAFTSGKLDVVVATTAFGMGIDKANVRTVVHTALPATLEGYYQEIGRAGRDGAPARAVLLHAFADTKTHEYFLERDYPPEAKLAQVVKALSKGPVHLGELGKRAKVRQEMLEKVLEKLAVHAGVRVDAEGLVHPADASRDFLGAYAKQRAHKVEQLEKMRRFAETPTCRMLALVRHFGDQHDSGSPCGICDACDPAACEAQIFRAPTPLEVDVAERALRALEARPNATVGQLQTELAVERRDLGILLAAMARAGAVELREESFEKDGKTIHYQRVRLLRSAVGAAELRIEDRPEPTAAAPRANKWRGKGFRRAKSTTKKRAKKAGARPKRTKRSG
jgi:superfamily II DNA helicase RecQ